MNNSGKKISLLDKWKHKSKGQSTAKTIEKAPEGVDIPLSPGQKSLWFLQQLYPDNPFYNYSETYTFQGDLNIDSLVTSLKKVYQDHDILRTIYNVAENIPVQVVDSEASMEINIHDVSHKDLAQASSQAEAIMKKDATKYFDLTQSPLVRAAIVKISESKHILQITLHHIVTDKWSMGLFREHIAAYYVDLVNGNEVSERRQSIQYSDYSYWLSKKEVNTKTLKYWKEKLSGNIPQLNLPFDFNRPLVPSFKGAASFTQNYSPQLSSKLLELSKELGTTPYNVMLSVYYILLYRCSGQRDILVGTPVTNRDQKSLEQLIGFFNDTLVLRTNINPKSSFRDLVYEVKNTTLEAFENKDLPFDVLVKEMNIERTLSTNPFFQVMFLYHSKPKNPYFGENLKLSHTWYDSEVAKFDLTIYVGEDDGILSTTFEYAHDLFEESTVNRFQEYFKSILEYIVEDPSQNIGDIPMLTTYEEALFLSNKETSIGYFESYGAIHHIIEDVATSHPNKTAVSFGNTSLTYEELNLKANAIANQILELIPEHNSVVGLCVDRSVDMIVGLLGILKAGCCYLPLDPEYPKERTDYIVKDSNTKLIITQASYAQDFDVNDKCSYLIIEDYLNGPQPNGQLPKTNQNDLAYIIYTSGSTGQPKGVPISHGNIINSTAGRLDFYDKNPEAFLLMSSMSFDSSKAGIFWTLCTGGNLVIAQKRIEQDIDKISALIKKEGISHTLMLPSLYNLILEFTNLEDLKSLTDVMVAGEACPVSLCESHLDKLPHVNLYNEYGPTEGTVWCIAHKITTDDLTLTSIPIGKSIANTKVYILDDNFNHSPLGVPGALYISGPGLSKGYINRPEKTNQVFIVNPNNQNEIIYKTGDLAKYNKDGNIIFLGRTDEQIKIRGYRVELSEIENTINQQDDVKEAVVLHVKDGTNSKLSAYIKPFKSIDLDKVKSNLKATLPSYMVPSSFLEVEEFPLLPNGKIDKKKLETLKPVHKNKIDASDEPQSETEKLLVQLWQEVLVIPDISINDNFFEIGGDSILSIQITAKARKHGIKIGSNQIFEHQSIAELAMFVSTEEETKISKIDVVGEVPLMPIQKWFFDTHKNAPEFWNQGFILKNLPENIDEHVLQDITSGIIENHPALRSAFINENSQWKAIIKKTEDVSAFLKVELFDDSSYNYESQIESHLAKVQSSFKLEEGGLFKCIFFDTSNIETSIVILLAHHLVVDFVSWQIIFSHFEDALKNKGIQTFKTTSIKEWGTHLLELKNSTNLKNQEAFWKQQILNNKLPLDFQCDLPVLEKDTDSVVLEIDEVTSSNLISKAHSAYNTKTDELLLVALASTISDWTQSKDVSFALERHGRETDNTDTDLSNTVGWFTAFYPKKLHADNAKDLGESIIAIKEELRNIEMGGLGYGILRYLSDDLGEIHYPKIVFNYLGRQSTSSNLDFQFLNENIRDSKSERHYYLEINALYKNDSLIFNWSYANKALKKETVEQLMNAYNEYLIAIVNHCVNRNDVKYTPSDFEDIDLDQDDLDALFDSINS